MSHKLSLISIFITSGLLAACQKADTPPIQEKEANHQHAANQTPAIPAICNTVEQQLSVLKKTFSAQKLLNLNQNFKTCLPFVPLKTRYQWLEKSADIYQQLNISASANVYKYLTNQSEAGETLSANEKSTIYKQLGTAEKYLVDHAKALYLEKFYIGEGEYTFTCNPQYDLDIFAPHLEKSDQLYLQQIRKEYTGQNYILDAGLSISFDVVANRLLFWENFNIQYPKNHFHTDVKDNIDSYREALFKGDDNTPVLLYMEQQFADPEAIQAINKVANATTSSSPLAKQILSLIQTKKAEWAQLPEPEMQEDGSEQLPEQQQAQALRDQFQSNLSRQIDLLIKNTVK